MAKLQKSANEIISNIANECKNIVHQSPSIWNVPSHRMPLGGALWVYFKAQLAHFAPCDDGNDDDDDDNGDDDDDNN